MQINFYLFLEYTLMRTSTQLLLLLISISFFSCTNTVKNQTAPISNIDTDFLITEKLELEPFNTYNILNQGGCMIDDSILWYLEEGKYDFGSCYNLHTGEKLSTIASKGRAANELIQIDGFNIVGDSVLLYTDRNRTIKAFSKKDIIDNVPMGERKFSITTAPDSIWVSQMTKLSDGSVLATIMPALFEYQKNANINENNKKSIVIFNNKKANFYETIKYESFDVGKAKGAELAANDLIKSAYSNSHIGIKGNDMAVFSVSDQFILYTFDLNSGDVINEKRYTKMQRTVEADKSFVSFETMNDRLLSIRSIKLNDKYILCQANGYFSEEDKNSRIGKEAIFVFDWELNPIKKFNLPKRENGYYTISNDGSLVYFLEYNEKGLTLYKADLNI